MTFQLSENSLRLRSRAYELLAVTHEAVALAPQITPQLAIIEKTAKGAGQPRTRRTRSLSRHTRNGQPTTEERSFNEITTDDTPAPYGPGSDLKSAWPYYLSTSDHPDARKIIYLFNSLPANMQRVTPVEAFCVAAGVSPPVILDLLVKSVTVAGRHASAIIAAASQPRVVQKNIEMALTDDGLGDRTLYAKITGLLPTPRGAQTIVSVQTSANASAAPVVLAPAPEQTTRRLATKLNEMRGLPAAPTEPSIIDMPIPAREPVAIDADYDPDDDDE